MTSERFGSVERPSPPTWRCACRNALENRVEGLGPRPVQELCPSGVSVYTKPDRCDQRAWRRARASPVNQSDVEWLRRVTPITPTNRCSGQTAGKLREQVRQLSSEQLRSPESAVYASDAPKVRVVVPAAAGSSPVAHPLRPCKSRCSVLRGIGTGTTTGTILASHGPFRGQLASSRPRCRAESGGWRRDARGRIPGPPDHARVRDLRGAHARRRVRLAEDQSGDGSACVDEAVDQLRPYAGRQGPGGSGEERWAAAGHREAATSTRDERQLREE